MNLKKRLIPILLAGLFIYPVLYQSAHKVLHHSVKQNHQSEHSCCTKDCSNDHLTKIVSTLNDETSCPVCDYHFSFSTPLLFFYYYSYIFHISEKVDKISVGFSKVLSFSVRSPRAPPYMLM